MSTKKKITDFVTALAKEDYKTANAIFPDVVESSVKELINKRKPDVIADINANASKLVSASVQDDEQDETAEE